MHQAITMLVSVLLLVTPLVIGASDEQETDGRVIWIGLANGSEAETIMAKELRDLIRTHDIEPWVLTNKIFIDERQIPHSHPVLTIHTRHIGAEQELLSAFMHEQLHWLEEEPWLGNFRAAMRDFENLFPEVPSSADGGARDKHSTYRHLLVCDMELQVMTALIGQTPAREILAKMTHYEWIYEQVLNDPRVREVALTHGFDVSQGIPGR
jgi:hypothetical protein